MNNLESVLVSYGTKEHRKQLEEYIFQKTGRRADFGRMDYDGDGTILRISLDLSDIVHTNVTAAIRFPGKRFQGNIDEFIKWHSRITEMHYPEAVDKAVDPFDVIALYYQEEKDEISYACFRMFDKQDVNRYLISSDGKALPFENKGRRYWLLLSKSNRNMLMFKKTDSADLPFGNISSDMQDLEFFRYLILL